MAKRTTAKTFHKRVGGSRKNANKLFKMTRPRKRKR